MSEKTVKQEALFTSPYFLLMLAELCLKLCTFMQNSLLAVYVVDTSDSTILAGLMTTVYMIVSVICRPISGNLSDRRGRFVMIIFGCVIYCAATSMLLWVPAAMLMLLLVMRVFQGIGYGCGGVGIYALGSDIIPESRMSEGIGILGLGQTVATALGPLIANAAADAFGYKTAFTVIFVLSVITVIAVFFLRGYCRNHNIAQKAQKAEAPAQPEKQPAAKGGVKGILSSLVEVHALKPAIFAFLVMFVGSAVTTFIITYGTGAGLTRSQAALFFTVNAITVALARLFGGKISQKFGSAAVIVPGFLCIVGSMLGISLHITITAIVICALFYGLGQGLVQPEINAMGVLLADKDKRGLANGTVFLMMDLGGAVSGVAFVAIASAFGYAAIYGTCSVIALLSAVLYLVMRRAKLVL